MAQTTTSLEDDMARRDQGLRFYDRMRKSIRAFVQDKGSALEKTSEYLLLVPDIFILLWRLVSDARVNGKDKVLLGSAVAYFIFPFDFVPEALVGPVGYLDDLVFAVFVLNRVITGASAEIVREHWSGSEDVLAVIQRILGTADSLIGSEMFNKVKKMAGGK